MGKRGHEVEGDTNSLKISVTFVRFRGGGGTNKWRGVGMEIENVKIV